MSQSREETIKRIFEHSEAMKRGMYSHMSAYFRDLPLSRSQLEVLGAIKHVQPVSSKEIARQLYLTPGAVSQSVESLEQHGYITRQADAHDRRIQYLKLVKKGEKLLHDIEKQRRVMMERAMDGLTTEELELWVKVQSKLIEQFQSVNKKP